MLIFKRSSIWQCPEVRNSVGLWQNCKVFSPVQFSRSVVSNSLWHHGMQHVRLPCPSQLPELAQIHVHRVGDAIKSSHLLWSSSPAFNLFSIRVFSNESALHIRWEKCWRFSFSIRPSNKYSGLISFRMDWMDLLAVQGTLKSLLQHHSSKESLLQCSAFFIVQLSHPYMTTGKTIALIRWTFFGPLLLIMSRLVITFPPRSKCLLISCLQSPSAVSLEPPK